MNIIFSADWHITANTPRIRTDNYTHAQVAKCSIICEMANDNEAALLIAGDIFDKPQCPFWLLHLYIRLLKTVNKGVYVIYGQHDIHFHNPDITRTALGILLESGAVKYASDLNIDCRDFGTTLKEAESDWLCIHAPITQNAPPSWMTDAVSAKQFLKMNPEYDIVISGDWHESFVYVEEDSEPYRAVFNPGPIMRPSKDKINFKPRVILFDDISFKWEWLDVPCKDGVFDLDLMDKDDRTDFRDRVRELASHITEHVSEQNFWGNLHTVVAESKPRERTKEILNTISEKVNGN